MIENCIAKTVNKQANGLPPDAQPKHNRKSRSRKWIFGVELSGRDLTLRA
jgi:hypothetical protein